MTGTVGIDAVHRRAGLPLALSDLVLGIQPLVRTGVARAGVRRVARSEVADHRVIDTELFGDPAIGNSNLRPVSQVPLDNVNVVGSGEFVKR